jgi:hypothetical protein
MKAYQRYLEEEQAYEKQFAKDYISECEIEDILWDIKDDEGYKIVPDSTSSYCFNNKWRDVKYFDRKRITNLLKEEIEKRFSYQGED